MIPTLNFVCNRKRCVKRAINGDEEYSICQYKNKFCLGYTTDIRFAKNFELIELEDEGKGTIYAEKAPVEGFINKVGHTIGAIIGLVMLGAILTGLIGIIWWLLPV